jgi:hypothetical protein
MVLRLAETRVDRVRGGNQQDAREINYLDLRRVPEQSKGNTVFAPRDVGATGRCFATSPKEQLADEVRRIKG